MPPAKPLPTPDLSGAVTGIASDTLEDWQLLPIKPDWSTGFGDWTPGEEGARAALKAFLPKLRG
ncbi:MAG: hypothetical protein CFE32_22925, partial [Alphaproteobacteria bacterium PA3]